MNVKSGGVWEGTYSYRSFYVEGLHEMMCFYGLKPYHHAVLEYARDNDFKLEFFSPYAVEIKYALDFPMCQSNDP